MRISKICWVAIVGLMGFQLCVADEHASSVAPESYKPGITMTGPVQAGITPDIAIEILKEGNLRFQDGKPLQRELRALVREIAPGQYPFASVVACTDSRSGPEIIFDQSIGDLFVARVAGNVVNDDIIGSLEYASKILGTRAIIVLGHSNCGAIKGACDGVEMGNLTGLLSKIRPAVAIAKTTGMRNSQNQEFVEEVTEINVDDAIISIREKSSILKEMEIQGRIKIVGAIYDTSNGHIAWR